MQKKHRYKKNESGRFFFSFFSRFLFVKGIGHESLPIPIGQLNKIHKITRSIFLIELFSCIFPEILFINWDRIQLLHERIFPRKNWVYSRFWGCWIDGLAADLGFWCFVDISVWLGIQISFFVQGRIKSILLYFVNLLFFFL